jgi:aspartokinase-like uncharacterized kinase
MIASGGVDVILVNGEIPQRVADAIEGLPVVGTRIVPGNC